MTHPLGACHYCADTRSPRRKVLFRILALDPSTPTMRAAKRSTVSRTTAIEWRRQGEARGCIPKRDAEARSTGRRMELMRVYPIGTAWTAKATERRAA